MHQIYYLFGVSGCGKTSIGQLLGEELGIPFYDGDNFHSEANIQKMAAKKALNDEDRRPWLQAINTFARQEVKKTSLIIACSALKKQYRDLLQADIAHHCIWVHLRGDYELIFQRCQQRKDHFMPPALLQSQFDTLEPEVDALNIDIRLSPADIVQQINNLIQPKEFGLIGLGVMGKSLGRNLARQGTQLALYNRHVDGQEEKVAAHFIAAHPELANARGFDNLESFIQSLSPPRKILLMIPAGAALDQTITALLPLLHHGDLLIDGGNAHYQGTQKRQQALAAKGVEFIGMGVSGGEEGALKGPSIMPGGKSTAYEKVRPILENIAARDIHGKPCCSYIGKGGAGHFVKMVHNGIEYAEMQLLAEVYDLLRRGRAASPLQIADLLESWRQEDLDSYLLEISIDILRKKEKEHFLIDLILDQAANKGTGSWTTIAACELGIPIPTISAALFARYQSAFKADRTNAASLFDSTTNSLSCSDSDLKSAYRAARILNHQQGIQLIAAASETYQWNIQLEEVARVWTNGCIIRSAFMQQLVDLLKTNRNLLLHPKIIASLQNDLEGLQKVVSSGITAGIALPCLSASLHYFTAATTAESAANIIQAQRDYFGAHTYKRKDDPTGKAHHTKW